MHHPVDPPGQRGSRRRAAGCAALALILLGAFGALAWKVHLHPERFAWDLRVENKLRTTVLENHHRAVGLVAALGGPVVLIAGMGSMMLLSWRIGDRRRLKLSVLGPLSAVTASLIAKPLVGRLLGFSFSFPSGHTTAAAALALTAVVVCFDLTTDRSHRRPLWPTVLWRPPDRPHQGAVRFHPILRKLTGLVLLGAALGAALGVALAVSVLRWHVISDTVGGLLLGPAMVMAMTALCVAWVPVDRPILTSVTLRRIGLVALAAQVVAVAFIRLPYFILRPGSLIPLNNSVRVEIEERGQQVPAGEVVSGTFSGLTVRTVRLTLGEWFWHDVNNSLDPIVPFETLIPPGVNNQDYRETQLRVFVDAGQIAAAVAERALGQTVIIDGDGVLVTAVQPGAPADGHLSVGEVITAIDGRAVRSETDLRDVLAALGQEAGLTPGQQASPAPSGVSVPAELTVVDVDGNSRTESVTLSVLAATGRLGLGLGVTTQGLRFELPIGVSIDGGGVGGPSAGLLTALTVYDVLSPTDVANGRHIAGTGTLSLNGQVGPIGGIAQKVLGAVSAGAEVFLAPAEQADEARYVAAGRIEVVGVATFDEAVAALTDSTR
ncbi:MAG: S16 family serine protease [Acidimicrobiales bacterium]